MPTPHQPAIGARTKFTIEVDGLTFRDLDADGRLTPYEDWRLPAAERAADLVSRMTLEEKAAEVRLPDQDARGGGAHRQSAAPQLFTPVERAAHLGAMAAMPMSADAAASSVS